MNDEEMLRQAIHMSNALSRRRFLRGTGLALGGLALGPAALAACGSTKSGDSPATTEGGSEEKATSKGSGTADSNDVYHANWTLYIDDETPKEFEKASVYKLFYSEEYNDNNEYFAKIRPELSKGNVIKPNIITPTFWLASRLIGLGWVEKLPVDKVPNAKNLVDDLVKPSWDPTGEYSLPWQSGMAGIAYNAKVTGKEIRSIDDIFDPKFKGKVTMLTEMRDTLSLVGQSIGVDPTKPSFDAFGPVFDKIEKAVKDGQIRSFTGNDYVQDLTAGNLAMCFGWSGDIAQLAIDNPDLKFVIPESGGTLWSDTMVIPKGAGKLDAAAKWMDFVYDPVNAARITATVQYISPVKGVQDQLRASSDGKVKGLADSPLLFPDAATLARLKSWGTLSEDEEAKFDQRFAEIQGK